MVCSKAALPLAMETLERFHPYEVPAVDVYETETDVVVKAELPGVTRDNIELTLEEDKLVLKGHTHAEEEVNEEGYHRKEIRRGSFRRVLSLPAAIKPDEVTATFDNGILTVKLARADEKVGKKIAVQ